MRLLLTVFLTISVASSYAQDCCSSGFGYKLLKIIIGATIQVDSSNISGGEKLQIENSLARVDSFDNVLIFTDCLPIMDYDKVGQIEIRGGGWSFESYEEMKQIAVRAAQEQYDDFDAILFRPPGASISDDGNATLIKFKK